MHDARSGAREPRVLVLGGYGALGGAVVAELLRSTPAKVAIGGRNEQRARRVALALGPRADGVYADADDPRTLAEALEGASLAISCASGLPRAVLERAAALGVPLIDTAPLTLERGARLALGELAWESQVPLIVHAGAVPGLAGIAAEFLVRRCGVSDSMRIATTGPWRGTPSARADLAEVERARKAESPRLSRERGATIEIFPPPLGRLRVRVRRALELDGFEASHTVERITYREADAGALGRWFRARGTRVGWRGGEPSPPARFPHPSPGDPFGLIARLRTRDFECELSLHAPSVLTAAAAVAAALGSAVLRGEVPAGLSQAHEVRHPGRLLGELRAAGLTVSLRDSRAP